MKGGALLCLLVLSFLAFVGATSAKTIYVPDEYATIQKAVKNADPGDTIIVRDAVYFIYYFNTIRVDKRLTLRSENGSKNCIVQAVSPDDGVFYVTADYVNISGFTIIDGDYGIYLYNAENCNITNNFISNNEYGIQLKSSSNNVITGNSVSNNEWWGIYLNSSSNNVITGNSILDNGDGIELEDSNNNTITGNTLSDNGYGIRLWGLSSNVIYLNNFINNADSVYFWYLTNVWNSTSQMTYTYEGRTYTNYLGNYWDDYTGSDADGDGIGDTPYSIDGDKDYYPLVKPFENYLLETRPPVASFTYSPEHPTVDQTVIFDASASYDPDGTIVSYEWNFGDGTTASGVVVTHAYSAAGSYTVTLTVTDGGGATNSTSVLITVLPPPTPAVSVSTDKYEYTAGDIMLINLTLRNPTSEWRHVRFLWRFDIPDYGLHLPIISRSLWLPPSYERTFTLRWRLPAWRLSFNASWYVALFDESGLISEDRADWWYITREGMTKRSRR